MDDALLADLAAEHAVLDTVVADLDEAAWDTPSSAAGWTIADQIHHLDVSDRLALASLAGEAVPKMESDPVIPALTSRPSGVEILASWRATRTEMLERAAEVDSRAVLDWVASSLSARTLVTTRLTECWAHGLDCVVALGVEPVDTDRLRHIVHQSYRVLPYALSLSGVDPPGPLDDLALDLAGPGGEAWWTGRRDAPSVIRGTAGEWCRVAVHRLDVAATSLSATGPLAEVALRVVRTYV